MAFHSAESWRGVPVAPSLGSARIRLELEVVMEHGQVRQLQWRQHPQPEQTWWSAGAWHEQCSREQSSWWWAKEDNDWHSDKAREEAQTKSTANTTPAHRFAGLGAGLKGGGRSEPTATSM